MGTHNQSGLVDVVEGFFLLGKISSSSSIMTKFGSWSNGYIPLNLGTLEKRDKKLQDLFVWELEAGAGSNGTTAEDLEVFGNRDCLSGRRNPSTQLCMKVIKFPSYLQEFWVCFHKKKT